MIGGGGAVVDVELVAKAVPESRGELWAVVRGDCGGSSKAGDPVVDEGRGTGVSGGGDKQCCGAATFLGGSSSRSPRSRSQLRLRPTWVGSGSRQKKAAPGGSGSIH